MVTFNSSGKSGIAFGGGQDKTFTFSAGARQSQGAPGVGEKIGGFLLSTVESFPELFGIEPSEMTQVYRAQNPVGSFVSQAAGAFVPYLGAAKLVRAVPMIGKGIGVVEGLGKTSLTRGALGAAAETAVVEAGRLGISATPLPEMIYQGVTGETPEVRGLGTQAGEAAFNIIGGAAMGGLIGGVAGRFYKGMKPGDFTGANPVDPTVLQARAAVDALAKHNDPKNPFTIPPEQLPIIQQEAQNLKQFNLLDVVPKYAENGVAEPGDFKYGASNQNKAYHPIIGDDKKGGMTKFLNRVNTGWRGAKPDKETTVRRPFADPGKSRVGVYHDANDLKLDLDAAGTDLDTLAVNAQDAKVIEVKTGSGKQAMPEGWTSPLDYIRDKVGRVKEFYHGTDHDIPEWKLTSRGGISFSTDPKFASRWAEYNTGSGGKGPRVYVTAIKRSLVGDFDNPADVQRALQASGTIDVPGMEKVFASGDWSKWENLEMLRKAGWDTVYMVEDPTASPGSIMAAKNIFVTKPELIQSAFDPSVQGAKNTRLNISEPVWNKPTSHPRLQGRANSLQKKFNNKAVWKDVGEGWAQAVDETGMSVMRKKVRGAPDVAAPGDRWLVFRTDQPQVFAKKSHMVADIVERSGYYARPEEYAPINDPLYQAAIATMKMTSDAPEAASRAVKTKAGAFVRDVSESVQNVAAPTTFLLARNPIANRALAVMRELQGTAEMRVKNLMLGAQMIDKDARGAGVFNVGHPTGGGFAKRIDEMAQRDLDDIQLILEDEKAIEHWRALNQRFDINGDKLISDKALEFIEALNFLDNGAGADSFLGRIKALGQGLRVDKAVQMLQEFQSRMGHYGITRDYPGAYKIHLRNKDGDIVGIASGKDWLDAEDAAKKVIEHQGKRGQALTMGGRVDEALLDPEELARYRARLKKPGFIRARSGMVGYELSRGQLDKRQLTTILTSNLTRRENFIRDIIAEDVTAPLRFELQRTSRVDHQAVESVLQRMRGDEGEFARAQNKVMDKVMNAAGLTGKDSASEIVHATQAVLANWQFNFMNLSQPVTNMTGIFQTLLPQISFIMHADEAILRRSYMSVPRFDGNGNFKGEMGVLSETKILFNAFKRIGKKFGDQEQAYQEFIEQATHQGLVEPRFVESNIGTDGGILRDPLAAMKDPKSFVELIKAGNTFLTSKSESLSRMITLNAAYELGTLAGFDPRRMSIFAKEMIARTNYNYGSMDRAKMFTTPVGSLLGTFKNWMFHYMSTMAQFATSGPSALPALMWQTAATGVVGGAVAMPLVMPLADGFSKFFTDEKFTTNLYNMAGADNERLVDGVVYGMPALLGVSLAAQTSSPGSDPARDASMIFNFAAVDRMKALSRGVRDALQVASVTGESPWEDANVRNELIRALAPRTIYRAMSLGTDTAVTSMATGYDVSEPMGLGSALLYGVGFNPVDLEKTYEVYNEIRNDQEKEKNQVKELGQTLAQAWKSEDDRLANRVFVRAAGIGIPMEKVTRSAEARTKRGEETQLNFQADDEAKERFDYMFDE